MALNERGWGIVLCGGRSQRMGIDKALIVWDGEPLIIRVCRRLIAELPRVIVVASPDLSMPELPPGCELLRDGEAYEGPLIALGRTLRKIDSSAVDMEAMPEWFFLTACDMPFVDGRSAAQLAGLLSNPYEAVVPTHEQQLQPLAAVYRFGIRSALEQAIEAGGKRLTRFVDTLRIRSVDQAEFEQLGLAPAMLVGCNTPTELEAAKQIHASINIRQKP